MIHVMFSSSAAGTLRQALRARGRKEKVIDLSESLDWGPIAVDRLEERAGWLDDHIPLGFSKWDWIAKSEARFRKGVGDDTDRLIWIAPRSAAEQAGLYWYLAQFGPAGATMVVADYPPRGAWNGEIPLGLGTLNEHQMTEFLEECPRSPYEASRFPADRWPALVAENALLRVVQDGVLQSAPEDSFDHFLLTHCTKDWRKWSRVLAEAMGSIWDANHSADSFLLTWRLRELIRRGEIACDGELPQIDAGPSADAARIRLP